MKRDATLILNYIKYYHELHRWVNFVDEMCFNEERHLDLLSILELSVLG